MGARDNLHKKHPTCLKNKEKLDTQVLFEIDRIVGVGRIVYAVTTATVPDWEGGGDPTALKFLPRHPETHDGAFSSIE